MAVWGMGHAAYQAPGQGGCCGTDRLGCVGGLTSRSAGLTSTPLLSFVVSAGQRGDSPQFISVLETIQWLLSVSVLVVLAAERIGRGRPRFRPDDRDSQWV